MPRLLRPLPFVTLAALAATLLFFPNFAAAQEPPITIVSSEVISEFPDGIRFRAAVASDGEVQSISVRFKVGRRAVTTYDYLQLEKGSVVSWEVLHRTDTASRYIPSGAAISYFLQVEDASGRFHETEPQVFIYRDPRFEWQEISSGPVTISYYGPVESTARDLLEASIQTLERMGPLLGVEISEPFRITMYNDASEMLKALPPGSTTVARELVTQGRTFSDDGIILVLGAGSLARGTVSHEVTHFLLHLAAYNPLHQMPSWLNEGLAEYGNIEPGFSYDRALEAAVEEGRLLPIVYFNSPPGTPDDIILFYGEARSIVAYLVDSYGDEKLREMLSLFKAGSSIDESLEEVYDFSREGLDARWREAIGAPESASTQPALPQATPSPLPTLVPYSLTPQPGEATAPAGSEEGGGACSVPASRGGEKSLDVSSLAILLGLAGLILFRRRM